MNGVTRARSAVLGAAGLAFVLKVMVAFKTFGTGDVARWQLFADGVRSAGPVGVYGLVWQGALYNHPPLIGYFLELVNGFGRLGVHVGTSIRVASSIADVASALLMFQLLRRRVDLRVATAAGILVGVSPVLFMVSGFHGNTDPIFTMLTLSSVWLLADRDRPVWAGAAMALALGVKIVPIVAVPALLVYAGTRGARTFWRFAGTGAAVFAITWGPALALQGRQVLADVIFYKGSDLRQWGLIQIGHWLADPWWSAFLIGPGRFGVLLLCGGLPAWFVWRRPATLAPAVGLSLAAFLLLSPAFGVQYAAWPVAGSYLIGIGVATLYNVAAGAMLFAIYNRWSGGLPWYGGHASKFVDSEVALGIAAWTALLLVVATGLWRLTAAVRTAETRPAGRAAQLPQRSAGPGRRTGKQRSVGGAKRSADGAARSTAAQVRSSGGRVSPWRADGRRRS